MAQGTLLNRQAPAGELLCVMRFITILPLMALCSGCTTMLPSAQTDSSTFTSFDEARLAVEVLVPMQSNWHLIETGNLNPANHPNATHLTQADIVRKFFVPNTMLTRDDLDPGVLTCVAARSNCRGIELIISKITKARTGASSRSWPMSPPAPRPPAGDSAPPF